MQESEYGKTQLNDLNPYSLDADGWCEPTETRVKQYDRKGPPVDARANLKGDVADGRSIIASHLGALLQQSRKGVAFETLWDRWASHPRLDRVRALFPLLSDPARRQQLHEEVSGFMVRTTRDDPMPLAEKLLSSGLSTRHASTVLKLLVELRHAWTSRSHDSADSGYDDLNWRHACGELAQVLDIASDAGLGDDATADAALTSLASDCAKLRGNFLTHHVDGAVAAFLLLPRVMPTETPKERQRVVGICQAILEHQVGPPRFMAAMCKMGIVAVLNKVGADVDDKTRAVVDGLHAKIADPMNPEHVERQGEGYGALKLTRDERALLKLIDLPDWYVPHPLTPWFTVSSAVIDADSLVNYVTADGVGKIVAICGPGTPFQDPTVFHSIFSCGASFVDAVSVMSDVAMGSVQQGLGRTRTVIEKVREGVARELGGRVLAFPQDLFDRIVAEERVDLSLLKVRRLRGLVVVEVTGDLNRLPYWSVPLDYKTPGAPVELAKLMRRKVADLLRSV
ncbi:MAG: hypothetical protein Q8O67_06740 [Deltaproteobacteria bacterium]|nr:hypothetical protein [Deltaproteobacteria bacterium]